MPACLSVSAFAAVAFDVTSRKSLPHQHHEALPLVSSRAFILSGFTFDLKFILS